MKKITTTQGFGVLAVLISLGLASQAYAYSTVNSTLDLGESNSDVTSLQTFFADNSAIYPEGLITGYFGSLTKGAVLRFQSAYGISQAGRVGPITREKINSIIASGGWGNVVSGADVSGPQFYNVFHSQNNNSATFSFITNENTTARIVYNTSPLMFNEGDINSNGFAAIGGYSANSINGLNTSHMVSILNLQPGTTYYYTVVATDASGNVSVVGPNSTFRTDN